MSNDENTLNKMGGNKMKYTNYNFQSGETLKAEHLNAMQNGIVKGASKYERFYPQCSDGYYSS